MQTIFRFKLLKQNNCCFNCYMNFREEKVAINIEGQQTSTLIVIIILILIHNFLGQYTLLLIA